MAHGIKITIGDLHLSPTCAMDLSERCVIAFGDDVCTVTDATLIPGYFCLPSETIPEDGSKDAMELVTESPDGLVFIDYVSPVRIFTVIRITDAVAE